MSKTASIGRDERIYRACHKTTDEKNLTTFVVVFATHFAQPLLLRNYKSNCAMISMVQPVRGEI